MGSRLHAYKIVDGKMTDQQVFEGDIITDFKEAKWMIVALMVDGGSFKVYARKPTDPRSHRMFFPSVFGLEVVRS